MLSSSGKLAKFNFATLTFAPNNVLPLSQRISEGWDYSFSLKRRKGKIFYWLLGLIRRQIYQKQDHILNIQYYF